MCLGGAADALGSGAGRHDLGLGTVLEQIPGIIHYPVVAGIHPAARRAGDQRIPRRLFAHVFEADGRGYRLAVIIKIGMAASHDDVGRAVRDHLPGDMSMVVPGGVVGDEAGGAAWLHCTLATTPVAIPSSSARWATRYK